jgi:hypothetical protein
VASFIPQWIVGYRKTWWLVVFIVRLIDLIPLILSIVLKSRYLPRPLTSCKNEYEWADSNNVPAGTPTMYELLPDPRKRWTVCEVVSFLWFYEMVLV